MKYITPILVIFSIFIWSNYTIWTHEKTGISNVKKSEHNEFNYGFKVNGKYFVCNIPWKTEFEKYGEYFRIFINEKENLILNERFSEKEKKLFDYIYNNQKKWDYVLTFSGQENSSIYSLNLSMGKEDVEKFEIYFKEIDGVIEVYGIEQLWFKDTSFFGKYLGLILVIPSIIISLLFFRIHTSLSFYSSRDGFTPRELFYKSLIYSLFLLPIWICLYLWDNGYIHYYRLGDEWYTVISLFMNIWNFMFLTVLLLLIYTPFLYISWLIQKKVDKSHQSEFEEGFKHGFKIGFFIGSDTPYMESYPIPMEGVTIPDYCYDQYLRNYTEPSEKSSVYYKKGYYEGYTQGQFRGEKELENEN